MPAHRAPLGVRGLVAFGVGGLLVLVGAFAGTLRYLDYLDNAPCYGEQRLTLKKPYGRVANTGAGFYTSVGGFIAAKDGRLPLVVFCENYVLLGPSGAPTHEVNTLGGGRYVIENDILKFSSSDNSDPNRNGRVYTLVKAQ